METSAGRRAEICIYENVLDGPPEHLVYFFHGLNGSATSWDEFKDRVALPVRSTVISVSFGKAWFAVPQNSSAQSGLIDDFTKEVLPAVEATFDLSHDPDRYLVGFSMGGYNAAQVSHEIPGFFSRVLLLCPATLDVSPFSSNLEVFAYSLATGGNFLSISTGLDELRPFFGNTQEWESRRLPTLFRSSRIDRSVPLPEFMIVASHDDPFGLFPASLDFASALFDMGATTLWFPLENAGHCKELPSEAIRLFLE